MKIIRSLPNAITGLRLLAAPLVVYLIIGEHFAVALVLFALAGVSDALDGILARRYAAQSQLGKSIDPLADKLLIGGSYLALALNGVLPWWLALSVVGRDVLILLGVLLLSVKMKITALGGPSRLSKINTLMQIILVLVVLILKSAELDSVPALLEWYLIGGLSLVVSATTWLSGVAYAGDVSYLLRQANAKSPG